MSLTLSGLEKQIYMYIAIPSYNERSLKKQLGILSIHCTYGLMPLYDEAMNRVKVNKIGLSGAAFMIATAEVSGLKEGVSLQILGLSF